MTHSASADFHYHESTSQFFKLLRLRNSIKGNLIHIACCVGYRTDNVIDVVTLFHRNKNRFEKL